MEKTLIFIPYQDSDDYYSSGILTREYAILYMLYQMGYKNVINIKKPRTFIDKKRIKHNINFFPKGTIEYTVKKILDNSDTFQYLPIFKFEQVRVRRAWWVDGYIKTDVLLDKQSVDYSKCLIYSNNPFAYKLIKDLKNKGAKVYFDAMDNFAIHPSLNSLEHDIAFKGYGDIITFSDCFSVNSKQSCSFMNKYFGKSSLLIKNGVFMDNKSHDGLSNLRQYVELNSIRAKYQNVVGYVGKIGQRIDADLVDRISSLCPQSLFVFIGPCLKGQMNSKLQKMFKNRDNVLHLKGIPSAYVLDMLDQFDILIIPHAVGKAENGGDPLKLYQYLTMKKPIMTTNILGVDEFSDYLFISNEASCWSEYIKTIPTSGIEVDSNDFVWENRFLPVREKIELWMSGDTVL